MQYLENIILYMEIGSRFIKVLLYKVTWRKVHHMLFQASFPTEGVTINGIEDFPLFSKTLKEIILRVEYESSEKIQEILITYGGLLSIHTSQSYKVLINGVVKDSDIAKYRQPMMQNGNYAVIHYNYFFIVDHFLHMTNPVAIECNHLLVTQHYLLLHKTIYKNIKLFFENNDYKLINISFGPYVLVEYIKKRISSFILLDIGYYTCRICLMENNIMREFYILNRGTHHMHEVIKIKHSMNHESMESFLKSIDLTSNDEKCLHVQSFLTNLFHQILQFFTSKIVNSVDLPIFINGLDNCHPLEYFFTLKMKRECYKVCNYFQWTPTFTYLYAIHTIKNMK